MLTKEQIIRAVRDVEYRNSLTEAEQKYALEQLPALADELELTDEELEVISGGAADICIITWSQNQA